jgi:DNA-directed RNA polymerase I subunit RPA1
MATTSLLIANPLFINQVRFKIKSSSFLFDLSRCLDLYYYRLLSVLVLGIMCHRARVLGKENTIQMHYANCSTYNADFDGDEMNLHLPQNELARAEAKTILINDQQYIVPKDGTPIRGLIQDHIVSGVLLTCRDTFLTRDTFQQLLYGSCWNTNPQYPIVIPMPAILKPQPLW